MAQDVRPSKGAFGWFLSEATTPQDYRERPKTADLSTGDAADFQVSLSTATSIAGLTAYSMPLTAHSAFVVNADNVTDRSATLSFRSSEPAALSTLSDPGREDDEPSFGVTATEENLGEGNARNGAE